MSRRERGGEGGESKKTKKMEEIKYLVAIHRAMTCSPVRFGKLKSHFAGDWHEAWNAKIPDFQAANIEPKAIEVFFKNRPKIDPDFEIEQLERCGARVLVRGTAGFPAQLETIPNPPAILFCRGEIRDSDFPSIAVVGSRKVSAYGRRAIDKIVGEIADARITIVSGLALGADVLAQKKALDRGSRTLAVLGNGIDQIYPAQNYEFGEKIISENAGAILSEHLPGVRPRPEFFPVRNRLVAGIARATLVIEAAERSGSLITANMALEMGRDVFAVPGEIFSENSAGTNALLSAGEATPATSGAQILDALGLRDLESKKAASKSVPELGIEAEILKLFGREKCHIDDLIQNSKFPGNVVASTISILEIKGFVKNLGNQVYAKNF